MGNRLRVLVIASAFLGVSSVLSAADLTAFSSGTQQTRMIELFTSEGCSSCPPADEWLSGLLDHPLLFTSVFPVARHVDYWDDLGWPDPLATSDNSSRQRALVAAGHGRAIYTPGFFINGEEWRGWFNDPTLPFPPDISTPGTLRAISDGQTVMVDLGRLNDNAGIASVHAALLGFDISKAVGAGENRGKTLTHNFVLLGEVHTARVEPQVTLRLPETTTAVGSTALLVWVENASGAIRQTTGGWLRH